MRLPAEWERQSGVMLTWPDETTPWYELEKVQECYGRIISAILRFEKVLLVTANIEAATVRLNEIGVDTSKIQFQECPINDTWARDHGGIAVYGDNGEKYLYDFVFNGWGLKFASNFDNGITKKIFFDRAFADEVMCVDMRPFVLEGGSIDTDGAGTLLTTWQCLHERHPERDRASLSADMAQWMQQQRVLWLDHGYLEGDDTDAHVDTLARFASPDSIVYQNCDDPQDSHYAELQAMGAELAALHTANGQPYRLFPLPWPQPVVDEGRRLAASYANFLIVNGAVLMPAYGDPADDAARDVLAQAFPDREIVQVPCRSLIWQNGSLHCITMQLPAGLL